MGSLDRQYPEEERYGSHDGQLTPVVKWLLIANVGIYMIDLLFFDHAVREWGRFTVAETLMEGRVWGLITFQFLHGSIGHLLFNSIALFFFGPWMERWWGSARFIGFYLLCGAAGALFYTLMMMVGILDRAPHLGMVGASAGIYGILIGVARIAPALLVRLLIPPITLTMRQLAIIILVIAIGAIVLRIGGNEGGEAGHLGGAILGFILVQYPAALSWIRPGMLPALVRPATSEAPAPPTRASGPGKLRPRTRVELDRDDEVDRILDKISQNGFQSLSEEERDTLRKAAEARKTDPQK